MHPSKSNNIFGPPISNNLTIRETNKSFVVLGNDNLKENFSRKDFVTIDTKDYSEYNKFSNKLKFESAASRRLKEFNNNKEIDLLSKSLNCSYGFFEKELNK